MKTEVFSQDELNLAKRVALRFRRNFREEAENTALLSIWRHRDDWNGSGDLMKFLSVNAYYDVVDEFRNTYGRRGTGGKYAMYKNTYSYGIDSEEPLVNRLPAPESTNPEFVAVDCSSEFEIFRKWTKQQRKIVQGLLNGKTKEAMAKEIGVSAGRISQILKPIKQELMGCGVY